MQKERQLKIRDYPQAAIGKISGEILVSNAKINVIDPNNNIKKTKDFMENGSVVAAFSHTDGDYGPLGNFTRLIAPHNKTGVVIAWKYLDTNRGVKSFFKGNIIRSWEKGLGLTIIPTVQIDDKDYYGEKANAINYKSTKDNLNFLNEKGHILYIAPTGHRNKEVLGKGVAEVGGILTKTNPETTRILPIATIPGSIKRGATTDIFVGNLLSLSDLEEKRINRFGEIQKTDKTKQELKELKHTYYQQISDTLMIELAQLLPEQYRGENT